MPAKFIFWDWNGTLLDDTAAAVATLNDMLSRRGAPTISEAFYRDNFGFPVRPLYERIGIGSRDDAEWDAVAQEYHDVYARQPRRLNVEALAALDAAHRLGIRQCVLSALRQDLLEAELSRYGIGERFLRVCGADNLYGAGKIERARELAEFAGGAGGVAIVGDSLHDKEVADAIGAKCVLCAQGSHSRWRLEKAGAWRTVDTLLEAVEKIGGETW